MLYTTIFISLYVIGWLICAFIPWLALSIATKGNAGLWMLPLCLFAGVVCALAVPVFGLTGFTGFWLSFVVGAVAPAVLLTLRRFAVPALPAASAKPQPPIAKPQEEPRTK